MLHAKDTQQKQHWELVNETLTNTPKTYLCFLCADANGQLGNRQRDNPHREIIGMNTNAENINMKWHIHAKTCISHEMIPLNTWKRNPWQRTHGPAETITWISPDGRTRGQIDCILIIQKYRNFATKTHTTYEWRGNMEQKRHRAALELELKLHFEKELLPKTTNRNRYRYLLQHHTGK